MRWATLLSLLSFSGALAQPTPCKDPKGLYGAVTRAKASEKIWRAEARLIESPRLCDASTKPATRAAPRIYPEVLIPTRPTGAGKGPWVLMGLSAALLGGVIYYDAIADEARADLEDAHGRGDQGAYDDARADLLGQQLTARGLAAGAGAAALTAIIWWAIGGEDDPVQRRPTFRPQRLGWGAAP